MYFSIVRQVQINHETSWKNDKEKFDKHQDYHTIFMACCVQTSFHFHQTSDAGSTAERNHHLCSLILKQSLYIRNSTTTAILVPHTTGYDSYYLLVTLLILKLFILWKYGLAKHILGWKYQETSMFVLVCMKNRLPASYCMLRN